MIIFNRKLFSLILMGASVALHLTNLYADYPRYKYIVTPLARLSEIPSHSQHVFDEDTVSVSFQIEEAPGRSDTHWLFNVSYQEYEAYLKEKAPAQDNPAAARARELISKIKMQPIPSEETLKLISELYEILGFVRTMSIVEALEYFPLETLFAMAGVKNTDSESTPTLVLRRFGVMRRRGPKINPGPRDPAGPSIESIIEPLVPDRYAHLVAGDIVTPFTPKYIPPPVQFFSDVRMSEFFSESHKSLLISWGVTAEDAVELSFRAFFDQLNQNGESLSEETIRAMKEKTRELDLSRLFFYVLENFTEEKALQTVSFIDGGKVSNDYYELPVEKRNRDLKIREKFPDDELIEVRGLAIDPELRGQKDSPINTEVWAAQLLDFVQNGGHKNTRFILQAYIGPARLYKGLFNFHFLTDREDTDPKKIHVLHASGAELITAIYKRYPHLKIGLSHDFPNRLNRRMPSYDSDNACRAKLAYFGHSL